jgi:hypothetical protein
MEKQKSSPHRSSSLRVWKALLFGWLVVNIPALIIMLGILLPGAFIAPRLWWVFLSIGFVLGWTWWSYAIPRWRRWALNRGAPADRLQKWAVVVGLTWPKGWIFEKTETRLDK